MPYTHLAQEERFLIYKLFQAGWSLSKIAGELGRHHTTISREAKRNSAKKGYRHKQAEEFAKHRRREASSVPRKMTEQLWAMVENLMVQQHWSPEQIAGRLRREGVVSVSAKWIYNYIWADRAAGGTLFRNLRRRGKKPCRRGTDGSGRGVIPGRVDISERPREVHHGHQEQPRRLSSADDRNRPPSPLTRLCLQLSGGQGIRYVYPARYSCPKAGGIGPTLGCCAYGPPTPVKDACKASP